MAIRKGFIFHEVSSCFFFFLKLSQRNFDAVSCLSSLSHFHSIAIYSFIKTLTEQKDREKKPEIGSETILIDSFLLIRNT